MSRVTTLKINDLNTLFIYPIPVKAMKVSKAVRVERLTVLLDDKGNIYASGIKAGFAYRHDADAGICIQHLVHALKALKVLTPAAAKQWDDEQTLIRIRDERRWAASNFAESAKALGLRLTDAQQRAVKLAETEGASK